MTARQAAEYYLLTHGRGGGFHAEDRDALAELLTRFAQLGLHAGLKAAKNIYRDMHPEGCHVVESGHCDCFLCRMDLLREAGTGYE